jgi:hypothetical protein
MATYQRYVVDMDGVKYGFFASEDAYDDIADALGVDKASDTDNNIQYGSDNKPPKVRINTKDGRSYKRFCDPDNLTGLITRGTLNSKKINGKDINSVRAVQ